MFLDRLRLNFDKSKKHIYAQEHQLYYYYNNFRGHSQKESKTVQYAIVISSVNVAGIGVYFIVQKPLLSQKLKNLAVHQKICQKNLGL